MRVSLLSVRLQTILACLPLALTSACGGTAEDAADTSAGSEGDGGCELDGVTYEPGQSVPSQDCNSCSCGEDGTIGCTTAACDDGGISAGGGGCVVDRERYSVGDVISDDGCNTCRCENNLQVVCTDNDCGFEPCVVDDVIYEHDQAVPGGECEACTCDDGSVSCLMTPCLPPPDTCSLPFESGDCDADFPVFWHNPDTGQCEEQTYGGCGGNDNRFETLSECLQFCDAQPAGTACEVNGVVYPSGSTNVPDPASCNTCSCQDGMVGGCTEIFCPVECEEGTAQGTECAECGPGDGCLTVRSACLPTCEEQRDCEESGGLCLDGLCKNVCG